MLQYEVSKSNVGEDVKLKLMNEDLKRKEHEKERDQLKVKMQMVENGKKIAQEDLKAAKVKEQELNEMVKKEKEAKEEAIKL
jgi:hypothetical protein